MYEFNSCYRSCAHGQGLLCLQLRADEAKGSIQWEMTLKPRLCVKTTDNCDKSHLSGPLFAERRRGKNVSCIHIHVVWPVFEIVLEGISELVELVVSVLYSAPKGFRPVLIFALKTSISYFELT